ncbi:MAG: hypothetical protein IJS08_01400, partial [Victivallales bacterium]|nr:hypothetical protein [Victivallales bacterium]
MISWAQIEKQVSAWKKKPGAGTASALDRSLKKSASQMDRLGAFLVQPHAELSSSRVTVCLSKEGSYPEWGCRYDAERDVFELNAVGVVSFYEQCVAFREREWVEELPFSEKRLVMYEAELSKLPSRLFPMLLLLQEVGRVLEVTQMERRRSTGHQEFDAYDLSYLNFVWAFRQLENIYLKLHGTQLRSDFNFTWFESNWVTGTRSLRERAGTSEKPSAGAKR